MKRCFAYLIVMMLSLSSCSESIVSRYTILGAAQGTTYNIVYLDNKKSVTKKDIDGLLQEFDSSCSIYNPSSLISKINNGTSTKIDSNIKECISIASTISWESDGMYDVTVKPLVEAYGFLRSSGVDEKLQRPNIDSILQYVGYEKINVVGDIISIPEGVQIDLNSIAQGYSVDLVAQFFESNNITNYLVEIGGEVYASGVNEKGLTWKVGVDKPYDGNLSPGRNIQTVIELQGKGLATSGNYRKFYIDNDGNRVNHTINPKTGESITNSLLSATIIASSAALADGYATLMMTLGREQAIAFLKSKPALKAYLVYSEGDEYKVYEQ